MPSCGSLERSINPYIESIAEPFVSQNQKEVLVMWVSLGKKFWKKAEAVEKSIHKLKAVFVYLYVCERAKKVTALNLVESFLRHIRNLNLLFKKFFKSIELLTKTSFFLYCRDLPENGEGNEGDVKSICARVTKHAPKKMVKAEVNKLIWIHYEHLIMDCFDCIFISTNNLVYLIPMPMFSLVSWFLYFLHHLLHDLEEQKTW